MKKIEESEELKEQFISQLKPLKIYLFGSFADGTYTEESDFDFYIIVSDEVKELKDLTTQAYRSIRKIKNVLLILSVDKIEILLRFKKVLLLSWIYSCEDTDFAFWKDIGVCPCTEIVAGQSKISC